MLSNAIKYNREGGQVSVEIVPNITYPNIANSFVSVTIVDTGIGIDKKDLPLIYNPFERLNAENSDIEGTGLGLPVVKRLTEAMNGKISVESTIGIGTKFCVEFPQCELKESEKEKFIEPIYEDIDYSSLSGIILYIEDNPANTELIFQVLTNNSPNVVLYNTIFGAEAVDLALRYRPDLILLDLNLPDISGEEVLKAIKKIEELKEIPIVVITADAMPHQRKSLFEAGATNYLTKPIDIINFLNVIYDLLSKNNGV